MQLRKSAAAKPSNQLASLVTSKTHGSPRIGPEFRWPHTVARVAPIYQNKAVIPWECNTNLIMIYDRHLYPAATAFDPRCWCRLWMVLALPIAYCFGWPLARALGPLVAAIGRLPDEPCWCWLPIDTLGLPLSASSLGFRAAG